MRAFTICSLCLFAVAATACATDEATDATELTDVTEPSAPDAIDPEARGACPAGTPLMSIEEFERSKGELANTAAGAIYSYYFHPNNGAHGGWIEQWRLCNQGGGQYVICAGGWAPVYYWNQPCVGSISNWYPQGWHG